MSNSDRPCPDCVSAVGLSRREFLKNTAVIGAAASVAGGGSLWAADNSISIAPGSPESLVKVLYESLSPKQKETVCFAWDYQDADDKRGLLRTHVGNNWNITKPVLHSDFYTKDQQVLVRKIFEGIIQPDWHARIDKQLQDDAGGFGKSQSLAIFGQPGSGKFEMVLTGRHMTLRCDGNSADSVAFGGPIFYGHAASGFDEKPDHPGNVFWHQALAANKVFQMLDGKQRERALLEYQPAEEAVGFLGKDGQFPGLPISDMSKDQAALVQEVLAKLIEPYRQSDRDEALACLKSQGGLEKCALSFYKDADIGDDSVWDCWRLEGPAFVWYFRGAPHVHVWVNVANDPSVKLNA